MSKYSRTSLTRVDNFKLLLFETVHEGEGQNEQDKHQVELVPDPEGGNARNPVS